MELIIRNSEGKETGRMAVLADEVFGIEPNEHAIYLDVKQHLANRRQGTHKAKEKGEVARTTKKAFKQKGTGNARMGSYKSPVQKGGGSVFGPRVRDYSFKLNKKVKQLARRSALSLKAGNAQLTVLENFDFATPKTKDFIQVLKNLGIDNKKSLFIVDESAKNVYLSSRNFQGSDVVTISELNTYRLMKAQTVVLTEASVARINEALSGLS
jgi:large subunit ribosomal protein L4